jgi:hypothetical protein
VDCTSCSSSGEVAATTLAAFDHRCYRSSHGDCHSSADTWMSLLQLFCYVATEGGCACYQRHSACLLRRHPWRTPRSSKRNSPGPSPTPPRPPMAPKLDRRSCSHGLLEHGVARDGEGGGATCGCRCCYTRLLQRAAVAATKGGSVCYYRRWIVLQASPAGATRLLQTGAPGPPMCCKEVGGGADDEATSPRQCCCERRRRCFRTGWRCC